MLFDSHCHPQFPQFDQDREEIIKHALGESVFMICVGTDLKTSKKAIELARKYEGVWATVGLHPNDNLHEKFNPEIYRKLLQNEKTVAFGEIGLDYYRIKKAEDRIFQKRRFEEQLELAREIGKPLVLHCRDAHPDMIQIIENSGFSSGVIHSFTGSLEEAKQYLTLGFYLSFNGIITFTKDYDEIVKYVPLEKILLETDAPYLAPPPFRGKRNEPLYVKYIAQRIAELKKIGYDQVAKQTFENAKNLFGIK